MKRALRMRALRSGWTMQLGIAAAACAGLAGRAGAAPIPPAAVAAASAPAAPATLAEADAALDAGQVDRAAALYERIAHDAPDGPEAAQARRALKILAVTRAPAPGLAPRASLPAPPAAAPPLAPPSLAAAPQADDAANLHVVLRKEPYSTRTSERLRLTTWEKLDFGVSSFLYGMSVGVSYALGTGGHTDSDVTGPAVMGALVYTAGAVGYLSAANPDRGDLPLALAITSYLPTTTLLLSNIVFDNPDSKKVSLAVATTGLLSIPIAILATRKLDLDPGDTQLVRDAGFWGLVLGTTSMLAWGGSTTDYGTGYSYYHDPSSRKVAVAGALGLFGGLGLGALAAANSEVSLERVRVSTWGGYGGALLGALIGSSSQGNNKDARVWGGLSIGALVGLVVTFASTGALDGIPPETTATDARAPREGRAGQLARTIAPSMVPISLAGGQRAIPTWGLSGTL